MGKVLSQPFTGVRLINSEQLRSMDTIDDWKKQYQVYLCPTVYAKIKGISKIRQITVEEWIDETLRKAVREAPEATEAMLQAIKEAAEFNGPTADIEQMLKEIESGYLDNGYFEE